MTRTPVTEAAFPIALPARYQYGWKAAFDAEVALRTRAGQRILDVGSGRHPVMDRDQRPPGATYVGLDLSGPELRAATPGSYDEVVVADVVSPIPALAGSIDLAVSWQVFEHVRPLGVAIENLRTYLRPGGHLISLFSGGLSAFGIANRVLPDRMGGAIVSRIMRRRAANRPVFPAFYDDCTAARLEVITRAWSEVEIRPLYRGATYFHFSKLLGRAYLAYENTAVRVGADNLATHYLLIARR